MRKQLLSSDDATPAPHQHKSPCSDCPLARRSLSGWLGGSTPQEYVALLHSEAQIECHVHPNVQCAGAAIYRTNVCKKPRDPTTLTLPANRKAVFLTPTEFINHHRLD